MKRQRTDELQDSASSVLEEELRRQIESFKAGERVAKEKMREMELSFLQSKQKLEAELEDEKAKTAELRIQVLSLQRELDRERKKGGETTDTELAMLRDHKLRYESYIAQGGFDFINMKVVHAVDNPFALTVKRNDAHSLQSVPVESVSPATTSPENLTEEIETLKKRIRRMNELFTSQTNRFRDAVYQLTGWYVEMSTHESKLRIRSHYANKDNDYLELLWTDTDKFELLETPLVNRLDTRLFTFISVSHSFPAFLSAVTQDLFEKQEVEPATV